MDLIYRRNAGIVVFNSTHKVLVCQRIDIPSAWQFPQGGIETGESVKQAALRELLEETSLCNVEHIISLDTAARYSFPPEVLQKMQARGFNNAGQDIFWSLFFFGGTDEEINLRTAEPEFQAFKWVTFAEACALCVDFKRSAYEVAQQQFSAYIESH